MRGPRRSQQHGSGGLPSSVRRCLVPADGFCEWRKLDAKTRQPFVLLFGRKNPSRLRAYGTKGRIDHSRVAPVLRPYHHRGEELMSSMHNRVPIILGQRDWARWLDRTVTDQPPRYLLNPCKSDVMNAGRSVAPWWAMCGITNRRRSTIACVGLENLVNVPDQEYNLMYMACSRSFSDS